MAVPKRKTSKARRDKRNAHRAIAGPGLSRCPQCNEERMPHRVCPSCGHYNGRTVIDFEEE